MGRTKIYLRPGEGARITVEGFEGSVTVDFPSGGKPVIEVNTSDLLDKSEKFMLTRSTLPSLEDAA
jgi:hypothetical protein